MTDLLPDLAAALPALPIPGGWITQGGAVGMLGLFVLMVMTGVLVPRRTVKQIEAERDLWRTVALKGMGHVDVLLPAAQISTQVAQALSDAAAPEKVLGPTAGGES